MSTVEKPGAAWPGIGLALGAAAGIAIGAALIPVFDTTALPLAGGAGAVLGLIVGSFASHRAQRRN